MKHQRVRERPWTSLGISLALQGGGSFGAFTWGVLERLLEDDGPGLDMISGASAGAVNAVLLADGLAEDDRAGARRRLAQFWDKVGHGSPPGAGSITAVAGELMGMTSPYQLNPLGLNPLRKVLAEMVDFDRLRGGSRVRLLIAATRVRDGHPRLFREHEVTLDAVLASACLPFLQHAVEIDGEAYWDGGYSANPPLRQLVMETRATDVLLVQLLPDLHAAVPHLSHEISRRTREIAFNASLLREQEAVEDLRRACAGRHMFRTDLCRKLDSLRIHRLSAASVVKNLERESALDTSPALLERLRQAGRQAAADWVSRGQE